MRDDAGRRVRSPLCWIWNRAWWVEGWRQNTDIVTTNWIWKYTYHSTVWQILQLSCRTNQL